jgi:hypothetical protein
MVGVKEEALMCTEPTLTLQAEKAIRSYLVKIFILPSALLTVIAFLLGYFIKDVAQSKAIYEVGKDAQQQVVRVMQGIYDNMFEFREKTTSLKLKAEESLQTTLAMKNEAADIHLSLETLKTFKESKDLLAGIVQNLKQDTHFIERITPKPLLIESGHVSGCSEKIKNWKLGEGSGPRESSLRITFANAFSDIPKVSIGLVYIDAEKGPREALELRTDNISKDGFDIIFGTWLDAHVAEIRVNWLAYGK